MKKLKLTTLSEAILKDKESKAILGGKLCTCSCYWQDTEEGSSIEIIQVPIMNWAFAQSMVVTNICFGMINSSIGPEQKKRQRNRNLCMK